MNHRQFFLAFVLLAVLVSSPLNIAAAEPGEDTRPPQLQSLTIEPTEVDVTSSSQVVKVKAHATDDLSGIVALGIGFISPDHKVPVASGLQRVSGTATDGIFEGELEFPRFAQPGTWTLTVVNGQDAAGNSMT